MAEQVQKGEPDISETLVRRLLAEQFPEGAGQPLRPVEPWGSDHAIFRLGDDLLVRLPRVDRAVLQVEKEQAWLPQLGPLLPFDTPRPVLQGSATADFPWPWSIYTWVAGEPVDPDADLDWEALADDLARFVSTLHALDARNGPPAGRHNFGRGLPLLTRDVATRQALGSLAGLVDTELALAIWADALAAPEWTAAPVWVHGDLQAGNLLQRQGRLCGVIDFGGLGVGDPACDLLVAWTLLPVAARERYRRALGVDTATWRRGRGWALSVAAIALPYYLETHPGLVRMAEQAFSALLSEPH